VAQVVDGELQLESVLRLLIGRYGHDPGGADDAVDSLDVAVHVGSSSPHSIEGGKIQHKWANSCTMRNFQGAYHLFQFVRGLASKNKCCRALGYEGSSRVCSQGVGTNTSYDNYRRSIKLKFKWH